MKVMRSWLGVGVGVGVGVGCADRALVEGDEAAVLLLLVGHVADLGDRGRQRGRDRGRDRVRDRVRVGVRVRVSRLLVGDVADLLLQL